MRNRDRANTAARVHFADGFLVQQCNAIPEQISAGGLQEQCALADGKFRLRADPQKSCRFLFKAVVMISRQTFERRPFLATMTHKLPLIFANWTTRRRLRAFSKLHSALHADKVFHEKIAWRSLLQCTLRNTSSSGTEIISDMTLPLASFTKRNVRSESSWKKSVSDSGRSMIFSPSQIVSSRSRAKLSLIVKRSSRRYSPLYELRIAGSSLIAVRRRGATDGT